ncbi:asparaginase [Agrobacterium sp. NPDC090273]|uniref:asparaginase n=1 Tax=Agrobacterium sp. NPDC090273 TaxID=3363919 RepID=UPI00383BBDCA
MIGSLNKPLVAVIATGGTIASKRNADGSSAPCLDGDSLLGLLPQSNVDLRAIDLMAKDSASLTLADMQSISSAVGKLLADDTIDGIVVLHGTDAMEESAMLVQLQNRLTKPVIFTGAQHTADHPKADGPANLAAAVAAATDRKNAGRGVLVCFGGRTSPAWGLYKHSADEIDAFRQSTAQENPQGLYSGDVGALRIDIIAIYPGCDGALIDASLDAGAQGIVLAALGSGNANPSIVEAVQRSSARNVPLVVSSRVPQGKLTPSYGGGGGGHDLSLAGATHSSNLRPGQARILLAALIAGGATEHSIKDAFA